MGFLVVCIVAVLSVLSTGFPDFGYSSGTGFLAPLASLGQIILSIDSLLSSSISIMLLSNISIMRLAPRRINTEIRIILIR